MMIESRWILPLLCACAVAAHAHTGAGNARAAPRIDYAKAEETAFGRAADPRNAKAVVVHMEDSMRYSPAEIVVNKGDVVRFEVRNNGKLMHELILGTREELEQHAELMRKHPGMEHDEPYMVHVAPGRSGVIGWQFTRAGVFHYACLIPGHFEAGMKGRVIVREAGDPRMAGQPQHGSPVLQKRD